MTLPLILLAILSIVTGFINSPWFYEIFGKSFGTFVFFGEPEIPHVNIVVAGLSSVVALLGIFTAWLVYVKKAVDTKMLVEKWQWLYLLLYNKYYIDDFYNWVFDKIMISSGRILDWADHYIIDGLFDGFARLVNFTGKKLRLTQTGYLQSYALVIFTAIVIIIVLVSTPQLLGGVIK